MAGALFLVVYTVWMAASSPVYCQQGPPSTPCCLKIVTKTAVSVTLTFKSNFNGGFLQTFTVESKEPGSTWKEVLSGIPDPGRGKPILTKITTLQGDTKYVFRVMAVNSNRTSPYSDIIEAKTKEVPNVTIDVKRLDDQVQITWKPLNETFSEVHVTYCLKEHSDCKFLLTNASEQRAGRKEFSVDESKTYRYSLVIYDNGDKVFTSAEVEVEEKGKDAAVIGGSIGGVILFLILAAVLVTLGRHRGACLNTSVKGNRPVKTARPLHRYPSQLSIQDTIVPVNVGQGNTPVNASENAERTVNPESFYANIPDQLEPANKEVIHDEEGRSKGKRGIEDITVEEFRDWLFSKKVTKATYIRLVKKGLQKAMVFQLMEMDDIKMLKIKPFGQEIIIRNMVKTFQTLPQAACHKDLIPEHLEESYQPYENIYAELNFTPDEQDYIGFKRKKSNRQTSTF